MTATLRVTSTSFLLPGNPAWAALGRERSLTFGDYGDWPTALLSPHQEALAWVVFLADLVPPERLAADDAVDALLAPLLAGLAARLRTVALAPTVVAWSAWRVDSPLRRARARSSWERLARALDDGLHALAERHPALLLVDLDALFASAGTRACYDSRNWYAAHCRLGRRGLEMVAQALAAVLRRLDQPARKVLVLDCDNTLWGGVVGEVGLAGLALGQDGQGQMFADFQRTVAALALQGLIICLASKNNAAEVWEVFAAHPGMVLKREQIIAARIDWQDKAGNVMAMAAELNLGLESVVFWDDNPLERERMRLLAPAVLTPEVPADVAEWPAFLAALDDLANLTVTAEDRNKVAQYRSAEAFASERRQSGDELGFLRSLGLRPAAVAVAPATQARAAQLCAKTNQFNLRTIRHGEAEVVALAAAPRTVAFLAHLEDRFGDHGLVAFAVAVPTADPEVAFLDTFLMSCRVLGRRLEAWVLAHLVERLRRQGVAWLVAEYRPTTANVVARDFLREHGLLPAGQLPDALRERLDRSGIAPGPAGSLLFAAGLDALTAAISPQLEAFTESRSNEVDPAHAHANAHSHPA